MLLISSISFQRYFIHIQATNIGMHISSTTNVCYNTFHNSFFSLTSYIRDYFWPVLEEFTYSFWLTVCKIYHQTFCAISYLINMLLINTIISKFCYCMHVNIVAKNDLVTLINSHPWEYVGHVHFWSIFESEYMHQ